MRTHDAFGILVSRDGSLTPGPQQLQDRVLTTGPTGNSLGSFIKVLISYESSALMTYSLPKSPISKYPHVEG